MATHSVMTPATQRIEGFQKMFFLTKPEQTKKTNQKIKNKKKTEIKKEKKKATATPRK